MWTLIFDKLVLATFQPNAYLNFDRLPRAGNPRSAEFKDMFSIKGLLSIMRILAALFSVALLHITIWTYT